MEADGVLDLCQERGQNSTGHISFPFPSISPSFLSSLFLFTTLYILRDHLLHSHGFKHICLPNGCRHLNTAKTESSPQTHPNSRLHPSPGEQHKAPPRRQARDPETQRPAHAHLFLYALITKFFHFTLETCLQHVPSPTHTVATCVGAASSLLWTVVP